MKNKAWEKDVMIFTVWNDKRSGGCFLGRLYVDLFLRKGKYDGASHHMLQPVSRCCSTSSSSTILVD
jgi:Zn-dependent oligopeptidase